MSEKVWFKISEKQLQGLVKYQHMHTRECLANAIRKQVKVAEGMDESDIIANQRSMRKNMY